MAAARAIANEPVGVPWTLLYDSFFAGFELQRDHQLRSMTDAGAITESEGCLAALLARLPPHFQGA